MIGLHLTGYGVFPRARNGFAAVTCFLVTTLGVSAQMPTDPQCQLTLHATEKLLALPHHTYRFLTGNNGLELASEMISLDGDTYLRLQNGQWLKAASAEELSKQFKGLVRQERDISCSYMGDEVVDGEHTAVFRTEDVSVSALNRTILWISRERGLLLRSETDIDQGVFGVTHVSVRHDYQQVRRPPIATEAP